MTKHWGPLGWATLHSVAACYPDDPSIYEKELFLRWIRHFKDTLLCPSCMKHFDDMVKEYSRKFPDWVDSRRNLCQFVFRAHNTVNARTYKKVYTLEESVAELQKILPENTILATRREYLGYIRGDWMKNMTLSGVSSAPKIRELNVIEETYWSQRTVVWAELLNFAGINVSPLNEHLSTLNSTPNIPKIVAPARGYSLLRAGKVGSLSYLR